MRLRGKVAGGCSSFEPGNYSASLSEEAASESSCLFFDERKEFKVVFTPKEKKREATMLLAGQSNMAGRGGLERVGNEADGAWRWTAHTTAAGARLGVLQGKTDLLMPEDNGQWVPAVEPMFSQVDLNKTCGISPAVMMGRALLKGRKLRKVRMVPYAVGATALSEWQKGGELYKALVAAGKGAGRPLDTLVWYQGESDALNETDANTYDKRLARFLGDLREDLGDPQLPVVLISPLGVPEKLPYIAKVQKAIARAAKDIPNCSLVTLDLKGRPVEDFLRVDKVHLTVAAQELLAKAAAPVLRKVILQD
uniref:Sialate O-acetylesterase domain-containing protein n=2 Tax=Mucochytrium quahogii TaxID=96639 RepID=A0A7S2WMU7_9STRA|mmetsp:Transcript_7549/g.13810  ORF Transcript_7549/g.13810 Transcript_7549/m.13810 type:complete len:309 (+) Transcript_7549:313-1239(+)